MAVASSRAEAAGGGGQIRDLDLLSDPGSESLGLADSLAVGSTGGSGSRMTPDQKSRR